MIIEKNQLQNSQTKLEKEILDKQHFALRLTMVMQRLEQELNDPTATINDLYKQYGYSKKVQEAILKGSLGRFGVTYKLTTQVIGNWIYEYTKKPKTRNDGI